MSNHTALHPARQFASDTYAGVCPEALDAFRAANDGHTPAYGDDPWTARATALLHELFETDCVVFFVPTGTAANALALSALCRSYHSVLCHADAHIQTDECGAPEHAAGGIKVVPIPGAEGKLTPDLVRDTAGKRRDVHSHKPGVLSLSQATESGTIYSVEEVQALGETARELGLRVHVDGARFANALVSPGVWGSDPTPPSPQRRGGAEASPLCRGEGVGEGLTPKALTWQAGVDVLSFGGTKNGMAFGDVVVFFDRTLAEGFEYIRKQAGHLMAKMRYVAAPWVGMLESGAWRRNAEHANAMARQLEAALRQLPDIGILYPVQANAVFVRMPAPWVEALHERGWHFYTIAGGERLMCSWDTTPEDVAALVRDLQTIAQ